MAGEVQKLKEALKSAPDMEEIQRIISESFNAFIGMQSPVLYPPIPTPYIQIDFVITDAGIKDFSMVEKNG